MLTSLVANVRLWHKITVTVRLSVWGSWGLVAGPVVWPLAGHCQQRTSSFPIWSWCGDIGKNTMEQSTRNCSQLQWHKLLQEPFEQHSQTPDGLLHGPVVRLALWPHLVSRHLGAGARPHLVRYLVGLRYDWQGSGMNWLIIVRGVAGWRGDGVDASVVLLYIYFLLM